MNLMQAIETSSIDTVRAILAKRRFFGLGRKQDPNQEYRGTFPLMKAVEVGETEIVELLLRSGAKVNKTDRNGNTALHTAIEYENASLLSLLIDKGADASIANDQGLTPILASYTLWNNDCLAALLRQSKTLVMKKGGISACSVILTELQNTFEREDMDVARLLLFWESSPPNPSGHTPQPTSLAMPFGNSSRVNDCAFSPDGKLLASADANGTVQLWDANVGLPIRTLVGHEGSVTACAFSPDSQLLASVCDEGSLRLWDVYSEKAPRVLRRAYSKGGWFCGNVGCAFSPDGKLLAAGKMISGSLELWDPRSGELLRTLNLPGCVYTCTFSPDSDLLVAGSNDQRVRVWTCRDRKEMQTLTGHEDWINDCAFSPNGKLLASASSDCWVRLWDPQSGRQVHAFKAHEYAVQACAFSQDGDLLVTAASDHMLRMWDIARLLRELKGEGQWMYQRRQLKGHSDTVSSLACSPNGKSIASGSEDSTLRLWNLRTGRCLHVLKDRSAVMYDGAWSSDGRLLASASGDGNVRIWDARAGIPLRTLSGHEDAVTACAFSPDAHLLASVSNDGSLRLWDVRAGGEVRRLRDTQKGDVIYNSGCAFSPDGSIVGATDAYGELSSWDVRSGALCNRYRKSVTDFEFSPDSKSIVSAADDLHLELWDARTGECIGELDTSGMSGVRACAISPDGTLLASVHTGGAVGIWDPRNGELLRTLQGHRDAFRGCTFSKDGASLIIYGGGKLRFWNPHAGVYVRTLGSHRGPVIACSFNADGSIVASSGIDGSLRLWDVESGYCSNLRMCLEGDVMLLVDDAGQHLFAGEGGHWKTKRIENEGKTSLLPVDPRLYRYATLVCESATLPLCDYPEYLCWDDEETPTRLSVMWPQGIAPRDILGGLENGPERLSEKSSPW